MLLAGRPLGVKRFGELTARMSCRRRRAAHHPTEGTAGAPPAHAGVAAQTDCQKPKKPTLHDRRARMLQGEHWTAAMKGHEVEAGAAEEDRKRLLLERFQLEVRAPPAAVAVTAQHAAVRRAVRPAQQSYVSCRPDSIGSCAACCLVTNRGRITARTLECACLDRRQAPGSGFFVCAVALRCPFAGLSPASTANQP